MTDITSEIGLVKRQLRDVLAVASNIAPANWSSLPPSIALAAWWRGSPPPRDED